LPRSIDKDASLTGRPSWNRIPLRCALAAVLALFVIGSAAAEQRVALVVGNSAYQNITRLDNPRNDATLMADTLLSLGFTLIGGRAARSRQGRAR